MKDIDNIEDWYREELNNYNVEPDKSRWDALSNELDATTPLTDETISDWYKKEVTKLEERPDYTVWEKLATQLDTSSVWDKLAVSLNRYDQLIWWRNIAIRGSAIFLLCFGSYLAYDNYSNNNESIAINQSHNNEENNNSPLTNSSSEKKSKNTHLDSRTNISPNKQIESLQKQKNEQFRENNTASKNTVSNSTSSKDEINQTIRNAKQQLANKERITSPKKEDNSNGLYASKEKINKTAAISLENIEELKTINNKTINTEVNRHKITERDISHLIEARDYLVKKEQNKIVFNTKRFSSYSMFGVYTRRFYAGFNVGLKKQGMITEIKEDSPLLHCHQTILLDFGSSFGGTVGFLLSDKINLETNINLNSTAGYKRSFDDDGISHQENLDLNYSTINILAKRMNSKSTFDNKIYSTNFIGGIYASYLRSAYTDADGTSIEINDYKKTDFGIVLGIEQDRYITKTLVITPGIRYNQGISNIADANSPFKATRNFSLEFNIGIKYIFLKKGS